MTFEETLQELINHAIVIKASYKHQNALVLSGYIIKKPNIVKHDTKDVQSCSFVLYQLNEKGGKPWYESYSCITYIKDLVEQFEQLEAKGVRIELRDRYYQLNDERIVGESSNQMTIIEEDNILSAAWEVIVHE